MTLVTEMGQQAQHEGERDAGHGDAEAEAPS